MNIEIDELLQHWQSTKEEISLLEKKCEKYKKISERMMITEGTNTLSSKDYTVTRKMLCRESLAKKDVPSDVWKKYAKQVSYPVFYLKSNLKRSSKRSRDKKKEYCKERSR
jgi:hypothetical protein